MGSLSRWAVSDLKTSQTETDCRYNSKLFWSNANFHNARVLTHFESFPVYLWGSGHFGSADIHHKTVVTPSSFQSHNRFQVNLLSADLVMNYTYW